jgi:hypothetical protein
VHSTLPFAPACFDAGLTSTLRLDRESVRSLTVGVCTKLHLPGRLEFKMGRYRTFRLRNS